MPNHTDIRCTRCGTRKLVCIAGMNKGQVLELIKHFVCRQCGEREEKKGKERKTYGNVA